MSTPEEQQRNAQGRQNGSQVCLPCESGATVVGATSLPRRTQYAYALRGQSGSLDYLMQPGARVAQARERQAQQPGRPGRQATPKGQNAGPVWCSALFAVLLLG